NVLIAVLLIGSAVPYTAVMLTEEQEDSHTRSAGAKECSAVISGFGFRDSGLGIRTWDLGLGILVLGFSRLSPAKQAKREHKAAEPPRREHEDLVLNA